MKTLALLLVLVAAPAMAQEIDCSVVMDQLELNDCAYRLYEQSDGWLNRAYVDAIAAARARDAPTGGHHEEALREAQRAWVTYRDRHCELVRDSWGSVGAQAQPMIYAGCLQNETELRTDTLHAYAIRHQQRPHRG